MRNWSKQLPPLAAKMSRTRSGMESNWTWMTETGNSFHDASTLAALHQLYWLEMDGGPISHQSMTRYFQCEIDLETVKARAAIECPLYRGMSEHDVQHNFVVRWHSADL